MAFTYLSPHLSNYSSWSNVLATLGQDLLVSPVPLWVTRRRRRREKWGSDHVETLRNKRVLAEWGDLGGNLSGWPWLVLGS